LQTVPFPFLGNDTVLCAGQSLLLDPGVVAQHYLWNTGDTTSTLLVSTAGLYSVQVINAPCSLSASMNLSITPLPVVNLGNDTTLCPGDSVLLDAQNPGAGFAWNTGSTQQSFFTSTAGTYIVTVTNSNCPASDTLNLAVAQALELGNTTSLCGNPNGVVLDAGNPGAQFLWNTGATTQTITVNQAGTYWVTITNGTCSQSDTLEVTGSPGEAILFVPNSFTPNGNGLNDRFTGVGDGLTSFHLVIFNRWGELIFETYDPAGWDGTYQGEKAKGDVYVYLIDYTTACTQSQSLQKLGHVTLIR
jgi:gliding motility-associated-like protein